MVFHPIAVHFPIAFYFLELLLLLLWKAKHDAEKLRFARFAFSAGYLGMLAALIAGWIDAGGTTHLHGDLLTHFLLASGVFLFYSLRAIYWRKAKSDARNFALILLSGSIAGCLLVTAAAFWGGKLVYGGP